MEVELKEMDRDQLIRTLEEEKRSLISEINSLKAENKHLKKDDPG